MSLVDMYNLYLINFYLCNKFYFELINCFFLEFCSKFCLFNIFCFVFRYYWEDYYMYVMGVYGLRDLRSFVFLCVFLIRCLNWRWVIIFFWLGYLVRVEIGSFIRKWLFLVNLGVDIYKLYFRVIVFLFIVMVLYFCS